eukprot:symbB.v1.2.016958.t1/scaffold1308.1/size125923/4
MSVADFANAIRLEKTADMRSIDCQPNLFTYNAAIGACQAALEWERALDLYFSMQRSKLVPDTTSYNLLLSSCARCRQRQKVEEIVQRMYRQQLSPDEVTFNCLSSLLTHRADRDDFLSSLKAAGLRPDVRTYNPMISACAESQGWEEAVSILDDMVADEVTPDIKSHNRLLDVCASTAPWPVVLTVFDHLKHAGHAINTATVNTCIGACASANSWVEAIRLLDQMESEGPRPDVISYNTALHACRHEGVELAAAILSRMQTFGIQPDVVTFNTVMCSNAAHWEWVLALLANMEHRGLANWRSYRVALHALIQENQLLAALNLVQQMHAKSLPLDRGTYNYLILALLRIGASEWAEHLRHRVGAAQLKLRHIICIVVLSPQAMADKVFVKVRPNQIDLHSMSGPVARFCLLLALRDEALRPSSKPLRVITGIGRHSEGDIKVKPEVLALCSELRLGVRMSQDGGSVQVASKDLTAVLARQVQRLLSEQELRRHYSSLPLIDLDEAVRAAFQPHAVWSGDVPEALGPPSLAFAAAPFWALAMATSVQSVNALLAPLVRPEALDLSNAVAPWLPFIAFASVLCGSEADFVWRDATCRGLLQRYADRHLRTTPSWKNHASQEWFSELMRGLCDRLAKIFLEESFMDELLACALWSFSAKFMPPACRAVCWGNDDAALLRFLDRALPCESSLLLWTTEDYGPAPEGAESKLPPLANETPRTWPRAIAARGISGVTESVSASRPAPGNVDLNSME